MKSDNGFFLSLSPQPSVAAFSSHACCVNVEPCVPMHAQEVGPRRRVRVHYHPQDLEVGYSGGLWFGWANRGNGPYASPCLWAPAADQGYIDKRLRAPTVVWLVVGFDLTDEQCHGGAWRLRTYMHESMRIKVAGFGSINSFQGLELRPVTQLIVGRGIAG